MVKTHCLRLVNIILSNRFAIIWRLTPQSFFCAHRYEDLDYMIQNMWLSECLDPKFFKENNPVLRHTVLRKRKQLEEDGLLEKLGLTRTP